MSPFEKALAWHTLGKAWSPNAASVQHVDAILEELDRVKAELEALPQAASVPPAPPNVTSCCVECGTAPAVDASTVNDIWLLKLSPRCSCHAAFHLWPRSTGRARSEETDNV